MILSIVNRRRRATALAVALAMTPTLASCSAGTDGHSATPEVVATSSVIGDIVRNVVGDRATVTVLMQPGVDPHEFQPSARQVADIDTADLVVAVGLGLEEGLTDVLSAARGDGVPVLELGPGVDPLPFGVGPEAGTTLDPHVWMDPSRMAVAVDLITTELAQLRPEVDWVAGASGYRDRILATDGEVADILSAVPEDRRKLVTNHDALGYFAARYGFEIVATVIPGGSTLSEPSGSDLAHLVTAIRSSGVTAIFAENTSPSTLADALAAEIGSQVAVYELYTGALGPPGSDATTYLDMMTTNAHTIADALGGSR